MSGATISGFDRWGGGQHAIRVDVDGPHVLLAVEATSGSNEGEALLTPEQARSIADVLTNAARLATEEGSEMSGTLTREETS